MDEGGKIDGEVVLSGAFGLGTAADGSLYKAR